MTSEGDSTEGDSTATRGRGNAHRRRRFDVDALLHEPTFLQTAALQRRHYVRKELSERTELQIAAVRRSLAARGPGIVVAVCPHVTRAACASERGEGESCARVHFVAAMRRHTNVLLGDCLHEDCTARTCRFVHYEVAPGLLHPPDNNATNKRPCLGPPLAVPAAERASMAAEERWAAISSQPPARPPAQWINCDVRHFDWRVLGHVDVLLADPPWFINMDLPYGVMGDSEMRETLRLGDVQRDGIIFLWVTNRVKELAHDMLSDWGYRKECEIVWVKVNKQQRTIRAGRTGNFLNHTKEHCLVGVKGQPSGIVRGVDCDVIVSELRKTSQKPDELYELIERLHPGGCKVEVFGREHNIRNGWITIGNQLDGVRISDPDVASRWNAWHRSSQAKRSSSVS